jgi:hypothetical protein
MAMDIAMRNFEVQRGKADRLAGKPLPPLPAPGTHSQSQCDYRMGWHVADAQRRVHPDWTDSFIMQP